jgi:hypothetical protein
MKKSHAAKLQPGSPSALRAQKKTPAKAGVHAVVLKATVA